MHPRTRATATPNSRARALRASATLTAAAALVTAPALPAMAADEGAAVPPALTESAQDGTWYFDHFGIGDLHEDGVTGEGVTVAVIDSPINPDVPDLRDANLELMTSGICENGYDGVGTDEEASHGTAMTSVIIGTDAGADGERGVPGVAPGATVLHYGLLANPSSTGCDATLADAVRDGIEHGAKIFSMSFGWPDHDDLVEAVRIAHEGGAIVDIAVANESLDGLDPESDINGVVTVENIDPEGNSDGREVVSSDLAVVAPGVGIRSPDPGEDGDWNGYRLSVGTSPATAWVSGVFALAWSKWPDATNGQLIQSLIRNTSNGWDELARTDLEGFGLVSAQNLAIVDPTLYPDENPLLRDEPDVEPRWSDIMGDAAPTEWEFIDAGVGPGTSIPTAVPTKQPTMWITSGLGKGITGGGLALVAIGCAAAALVLLLRGRRGTRAAGPGAPFGQPAGVAAGWPAAAGTWAGTGPGASPAGPAGMPGGGFGWGAPARPGAPAAATTGPSAQPWGRIAPAASFGAPAPSQPRYAAPSQFAPQGQSSSRAQYAPQADDAARPQPTPQPQATSQQYGAPQPQLAPQPQYGAPAPAYRSGPSQSPPAARYGGAGGALPQRPAPASPPSAPTQWSAPPRPPAGGPPNPWAAPGR